MPEFFSPEFALVVSSKVRDAFRDLPMVSFAPVTFKTLFEFPFWEEDFSFYQTIGDYFAIERFIDRQIDTPALHENIGEYFEIISPPVRVFREQYQLVEANVRFGPLESDEKQILTSLELLNDVPVYSQGGHVMSEAVFQRLQPFINWTYYVHGEGMV